MSKQAKSSHKGCQTDKCTSCTEDKETQCTKAYDIKSLLKTENYQTKPNMSKFLKRYVDSITLLISEGKASMWPKVSYTASKSIVRFKDSSTLIKCYYTQPNQIFLFSGYDELALSSSTAARAEEFFKMLENFNFIRLCRESTGTGVFTPNLSAVNGELDMEVKCS